MATQTTPFSKSASAAALGITNAEFEKRAKKAGFKTTEEYWNSIGGASAPLQQAIAKQMVELDKQLDELTPYISLSDEEKQGFLDKALQEITPYYERKTAELEAGLKEGKLRTAQDILTSMREVEETTKTSLAKFDLTTAQTEEEFVNRLSDITSTKGEDLATKRLDYQQRLESLKANQVQQGTLTSGIGAKKRTELGAEQQMGEATLERRSQADVSSLETAKKYSLDQVQLSRQAAEQARARTIGGTTEADLTKQQAMQTAGITDMNQLGSAAELARQQAERGITPITGGAVQTADLEAEKLKAQESTAQELQADELARKEAEYGMTRDQILAERARKASQVSALR